MKGILRSSPGFSGVDAVAMVMNIQEEVNIAPKEIIFFWCLNGNHSVVPKNSFDKQ